MGQKYPVNKPQRVQTDLLREQFDKFIENPSHDQAEVVQTLMRWWKESNKGTKDVQ